MACISCCGLPELSHSGLWVVQVLDRNTVRNSHRIEHFFAFCLKHWKSLLSDTLNVARTMFAAKFGLEQLSRLSIHLGWKHCSDVVYQDWWASKEVHVFPL